MARGLSLPTTPVSTLTNVKRNSRQNLVKATSHVAQELFVETTLADMPVYASLDSKRTT